MTVEAHKTTSLGWRTAKTLQQGREWLELQFSQLGITPPQAPDWPWLKPVVQGLFWIVALTLALLLAAWLYQLGRTYLQRYRPRSGQRPPAGPTPALKRADQWWQDAQTLAAQGDYSAACKALYSAALLRLNDTQQVPYLASRTNREYIACLSHSPHPRPYELLIRTHERLTFGTLQASAEIYQRCQRAYQEIRE